MRLLVYGGSGSGKSSFAEDYIASLPDAGKLVYIATMNPAGADARERIARHRQSRQDKGFLTIEHYVDLARVELPPKCSVLLECLGNLLANEIFSVDGSHENAEKVIMEGVAALARHARTVVLVSNDLVRDGCAYSGETERYIRTLAILNQRLARDFDMVVETVCGIPLLLKG